VTSGGAPRWALCASIWLTGCTDTPPPAPNPDLPAGWVTDVVTAPTTVLDRMATHTDGWAAFHRGDLLQARDSADEALQQRARIELAVTRSRLVDLTRVTAPALARARAQHGGIPEGSAVHTWAALVVASADEDPTPLLALAPAPADPHWAHVHGALGSDLPEEGRFHIVAERTAGPIGDCLRAHHHIRAGKAAFDLLDTACPTPFLSEAGGSRTLPDPLRGQTASIHWPVPDAPAEALAATLFSASWGPDDRTDPARGPTARRLGLGPADSPAAALAQVQTLTRTLDTWQPGADAPGARLAADLDAFDVYRTHIVDAWVDTLLTHPLTAAEALRAARDADAGRTIGPTRPPRLLALEARVSVASGHIRSALPALAALAPLAPALPELPALTELVNDLQVATTLGRTGDSKEP